MHVKFKFTDATFSSILRGTDWSPERLANLMYTSQNQRWLQVGLVSTLLEILPGKERIQKLQLASAEKKVHRHNHLLLVFQTGRHG